MWIDKTNSYPVGNRYKKRYWNKGNRRKQPQNERMRCTDCGGQFHEQTQVTKMDTHCFKMSAGKCIGQKFHHHGWQSATSRGKREWYYTISDSTEAMAKWEREELDS